MGCCVWTGSASGVLGSANNGIDQGDLLKVGCRCSGSVDKRSRCSLEPWLRCDGPAGGGSVNRTGRGAPGIANSLEVVLSLRAAATNCAQALGRYVA